MPTPLPTPMVVHKVFWTSSRRPNETRQTETVLDKAMANKDSNRPGRLSPCLLGKDFFVCLWTEKLQITKSNEILSLFR